MPASRAAQTRVWTAQSATQPTCRCVCAQGCRACSAACQLRGSGALSGACGHAKPFHLPPASIAAFWRQTCGILPGRSAWSARTPTTPPCCGTASVWRRARTPTARPAPAPMPTHVTSALAVRGVRARAGRLRNTTHASHCQETWFRRCLIPMPPLFSSCYAQHAKCCKSEHLPCSAPSTLQATAW